MTKRICAKEVECYATFQRLQSHSNLVSQIFPYFFIQMCKKFGKAVGKMPDTNLGRVGNLENGCVLWMCDIVRGS